MQRRLAAILSADLAGYSRLMHEDEEGTLAALKAHRGELIEPKIAAYGGRIVKTIGDGVLLEFSSAVDAVRCAVEIQREMARRNEGVTDRRRMLFRMGINLGDVLVEGEDIYGDGVNVAARLETLSDPGGICISHRVYEQVAGKIAANIHDIGEQALKNIEAAVHAYRIETAASATAATGRRHVSPASPGFEFSRRERPSIALLPFRNLSGDPAQDYLAEGLRLGILSSLVQLSGLFLIGTEAVNGYREREAPAAQIACEVGVRYVLGGAVQRTGDRIRATLQLTDVEAREIIWAERYDRVLDDLFKMQDEITQEVIISLDVELLGREHDRIWFSQLTGPESRELYLRGISHLYAGTKDDNAAAGRMFEELARVQPDTVHGPGCAALTHWLDAYFGWAESASRSRDRALEWAEKALTYKQNNGFGYVVLGHLQLFEGKHDEALKNCRVAADLRASCPLAFGLLSSVQTYCGDPQEAVKNAREALQLERIYPPWLINILAAAYRDGGKVGLSIPAAKEATRLDPEQTDARIILCSDYALGGARDQARDMANEITGLDPSFRLSSYAASQPYKDAATLDRLIDNLREAGLPE